MPSFKRSSIAKSIDMKWQDEIYRHMVDRFDPFSKMLRKGRETKIKPEQVTTEDLEYTLCLSTTSTSKEGGTRKKIKMKEIQ